MSLLPGRRDYARLAGLQTPEIAGKQSKNKQKFKFLRSRNTCYRQDLQAPDVVRLRLPFRDASGENPSIFVPKPLQSVTSAV
jgi:hypothetical protein